MNAPDPDKDLMQLLRTDINRGFRLVVEKYSSRLYRHIRRLVILHEDADDALQNTFINAWKKIKDFRNESSLYAWLYAIATNEALTLINRRKRNESVPLDEISSYFAVSAEGSAWFDGDEAQVFPFLSRCGCRNCRIELFYRKVFLPHDKSGAYT